MRDVSVEKEEPVKFWKSSRYGLHISNLDTHSGSRMGSSWQRYALSDRSCYNAVASKKLHKFEANHHFAHLSLYKAQYERICISEQDNSVCTSTGMVACTDTNINCANLMWTNWRWYHGQAGMTSMHRGINLQWHCRKTLLHFLPLLAIHPAVHVQLATLNKFISHVVKTLSKSIGQSMDQSKLVTARQTSNHANLTICKSTNNDKKSGKLELTCV